MAACHDIGCICPLSIYHNLKLMHFCQAQGRAPHQSPIRLAVTSDHHLVREPPMGKSNAASDREQRP